MSDTLSDWRKQQREYAEMGRKEIARQAVAQAMAGVLCLVLAAFLGYAAWQEAFTSACTSCGAFAVVLIALGSGSALTGLMLVTLALWPLDEI